MARQIRLPTVVLQRASSLASPLNHLSYETGHGDPSHFHTSHIVSFKTSIDLIGILYMPSVRSHGSQRRRLQFLSCSSSTKAQDERRSLNCSHSHMLLLLRRA